MNTQSETHFSRRTTAWVLFSIIASVIWLYWPALGFDFVNWDDPWYIANNDLIKSWHPSNLVGIATQNVTRNFAPLTILSFLIDHTLWGLMPTGYHLTNILLHGINAVLAFFLLRQITRNEFVAWTAAILFAVHPAQVESVVWISSRKTLLSATFMLASLIYWCRTERTGREEGISIGFLCAALLSKAIAVVMPPIMLMYDVMVRRKPVGESVVRQIIPGVAAFLLLAMTMSSQTEITGGLRDHLALSKIHLLAIDTTLLWRYVGMLVCPGDQCVLYNPPTTGIALAVISSSIGLLCVGATAWMARKKYPIVTLAVATFYILFVPVLNLFPLTTLMNDRYLYLPSIVFFGLTGAAAHQLCDSLRSILGGRLTSGVRLTVTGSAAIAFMFGTAAYVPVWQNSNTLWTHAMDQAPELMVVRIQLASTYWGQGRENDALLVLNNALRDCPPDAIDRPRIETLLSDWLQESARASAARRAAVRTEPTSVQ